jgi:hypothetical protein
MYVSEDVWERHWQDQKEEDLDCVICNDNYNKQGLL